MNQGLRRARRRSLAPIFHDLAERINRRSILLLISDLFDELADHPGRPEAPAPQAARGGRLTRPGRRRADFPFQEATLFRGLEQYPELLTDPRSLREGYLERVSSVRDRAAARLPQPEHRLCAVADRRQPGRGAVELPGASAGAIEAIGVHREARSSRVPLCVSTGPRWRPPWARCRCRSSFTCSIAAASRSSPGRPCASCSPPSARTAAACASSRLILLAVRCLLLLLLVLAMASVSRWAERLWRWLFPETCAFARLTRPPHSQDPRRGRLVQHGGQDRRQRPPSTAPASWPSRSCTTSPRGDGFSVVLMSAPPRRIVPEPSEDATKVAKEIDRPCACRTATPTWSPRSTRSKTCCAPRRRSSTSARSISSPICRSPPGSSSQPGQVSGTLQEDPGEGPHRSSWTSGRTA